jgi:hypothetical protein
LRDRHAAPRRITGIDLQPTDHRVEHRTIVPAG